LAKHNKAFKSTQK